MNPGYRSEPGWPTAAQVSLQALTAPPWPPLFQTRQPVFVQLLQGVFRVYHCNWLAPSQKASVESCIRVLSDVGEDS